MRKPETLRRKLFRRVAGSRIARYSKSITRERFYGESEELFSKFKFLLKESKPTTKNRHTENLATIHMGRFVLKEAIRGIRSKSERTLAKLLIDRLINRMIETSEKETAAGRFYYPNVRIEKSDLGEVNALSKTIPGIKERVDSMRATLGINEKSDAELDDPKNHIVVSGFGAAYNIITQLGAKK